MRRAYVGLSTPIGFDYKNEASKAPADTFSSPNPVLDSPFGLLLLFDELVFLTRSLCPENMRHLPYVSFLDESGKLPIIDDGEIQQALENAWAAEAQQTVSVTPFRDSIQRAGVLKDMLVDNHSHGLSIGSIQTQANASLSNLALDFLILSKQKGSGLELVTNSRLQPKLEDASLGSTHLDLTELLVIQNIPNYLTPTGPYHPVVDEVRGNKYLTDFRKWIASRPKNVSRQELDEMRTDIEFALQEAQDDYFLKNLDSKRHYTSIGKAVVGDAIGFLFPFSGTVSAIAESTIDAANDADQYWQGFLVGARRQTRRAFRSRK